MLFGVDLVHTHDLLLRFAECAVVAIAALLLIGRIFLR